MKGLSLLAALLALSACSGIAEGDRLPSEGEVAGESLGPGYVGRIGAHLERVMLYDIEKANAERKTAAETDGEDSD